MADAILIEPRTGAFDRYLDWGRVPLELLSVGSLPYQKGYDVKIIDQRAELNWKEAIRRELTEKTLAVGIPSLTGNKIKHGLECAKFVREEAPNVRIVWGGTHATLVPEQTLANPYVDALVLGEGDFVFYEILEALRTNHSLHGIQGVWYKTSSGEVVKNPRRPFIKNLDELPELSYELVDKYMEKYLNRPFGRGTDAITSRGCGGRCYFCYNLVFNGGFWRGMSAEETLRRLTNVVHRYNLEFVCFLDDNLFMNLERLKKICQGIIDSGLNITWRTIGVRVDTLMKMDDSFLKLLWDSGCREIYVGGETGSPEMMSHIDKNLNVEDMPIINRKLAKFNFILKFTFICGYPHEGEEQVQATVKLAEQLCRENPNTYTPFFLLAPYPGTKVFDEALSLGFHSPTSLEEWGNFNQDDWVIKYPPWYSKAKARRLNSIAFTSFFLNPRIANKIDNRLLRWAFKIYGPIARIRFKHNLHGLPVDSIMGRYLTEYL